MSCYLLLTTSTNQIELLDSLTQYFGAPLTNVSAANQPETSLTIEQVRDLLSTTQYKTRTSYTTPINWLLWNIHTSSIPAQHALLKVLEEPPTDTSIFLIAPSVEQVLDTIQSRCSIVKIKTIKQATTDSSDSTTNYAELYIKICSGSIPDLIERTETWKTVDEATTMLKGLVSWLRQSDMFPSKIITNHLKLLTAAHAAFYANANLKLTLEHCFFAMNQSRFK